MRPRRPQARVSLSPLAAALAVALLFAGRASAAPVGAACASDKECDAGAICSQKLCTAISRTRNVVPFYFHQPGEVGHRYIIPVLWFSTWDRETKIQLQFPFFLRIKQYADQKENIVIPPLLTQVIVSPTEKTFRLLPFFFYSHYKGDERGDGTTQALLPLYWYSRVGKRFQFIAPLLASGFASDEREHTAFGMFGLLGIYWRHGDSSFRAAIPLYWDHETADTRTILAPLVYYHRDEKRRRLLSIVAAWEKDEDARLEQLFVYAPPIFYRRDPFRDIDVVPPFYARWRVHEDGSSGLIIGNFYRSTDPEGSTNAFLPLYWGFHDRRSGASTHILFPLGGFHGGPGLKGFVVGPLFGWRNRNGVGSSGLGLAPLFFFHRSGSRHQEVVLPLFARFGDDARGVTTTAVGPFFGRTTPDGWDAGALPLLYFGRHAGHSYAYLPPLFLHRSTPTGTLDVVGPGYFYRGTRGWAAGLAPLFFFGNLDGREHQVVAPLFYRTRDATHEAMLIGPYYHRRDPRGALDVLFPLLYLRRTPKETSLVSPVAYYSRDAARSTLWTGLWLDREDFKANKRTRVFFPFVFVHDAPAYHVRVVFPFFWHVRDGDETDLALFPFYYRVRSPGRAIDALAPLVLWSRTETAKTLLVGPFWWRERKDGGGSLGLAPLFAYYRRSPGAGAYRWAGGPGFFWWRDEATGGSNLVAGPYFDVRRPQGYTAGLVPIAFAWRRGTRSEGVAAPFVYWQRDPAAARALTVVGPVYVERDGPVKRFGVAPFVFHKNDGEGTDSTLVLPLGYFEKSKLGHRVITPIFGYNARPTGYSFYALTYYQRNDEEFRSTALWPLAYFRRNKVTGARIGMVLPLFFDGRTEDGRELQAYSPLVWRYKSVEWRVLMGLPLFLDAHAVGESRTTTVLPFFVRYDSKVSNSTSWVIPPLATWWRHRRADDATDAVVFPLFWRFGGKSESTVLFPLFFDFARGSSRTTLIPPLGGHWVRHDGDRQDGNHYWVLNSYLKIGDGPEMKGSWYFHFFPLLDFGRPRPHDLEWNFALGLLGYKREGVNRTLWIFWFFPITLSPAPAASVSFFGATPPSARTGF